MKAVGKLYVHTCYETVDELLFGAVAASPLNAAHWRIKRARWPRLLLVLSNAVRTLTCVQ